jgi:hypothetical protein
MSVKYHFLPVLLLGIVCVSFNGNMPQKGCTNTDEL